MKKLIGIGIAAMMLVGLAVSANAAAAAWTLQLRAGVLNGTVWSNSAALGQIGIAAAAATRTYTTVAATQAAFLNTDGTVGLLCNKDMRATGQATYVWRMVLNTGASYPAGLTTIGAWVPSSTQAPLGWIINAYRISAPAIKYGIVDNGLYGTAQIKTVSTVTAVPTSYSEAWAIEATIIPEPGSMVAMLSGLIGLVGYGIRRRK